MGWGTEEILEGYTLALKHKTRTLDQGLLFHVCDGAKWYLCSYVIYVCVFSFVHLSFLPWACALEGSSLAEGVIPETWPERCQGLQRHSGEGEYSLGHKHCSLCHLGSTTDPWEKVVFTQGQTFFWIWPAIISSPSKCLGWKMSLEEPRNSL